MQTLNISAMKLIFPMKFVDSFHKVYGSFGEYSTLISKSGYPAINGQSYYNDMSGGTIASFVRGHFVNRMRCDNEFRRWTQFLFPK